jgi:hypothetical protein
MVWFAGQANIQEFFNGPVTTSARDPSFHRAAMSADVLSRVLS